MDKTNFAKLDDAFKLITTKPLLVLLLAVPSINHLLIHTKSSLLLKINFVFILTGVFAVPIIYGIFLDALKGSKSSLVEISKRYILNYILTIIVVYIPLTVMVYVKSSMGVPHNLFDLLLRIGIDVITIYVLPFVFITNHVFKSILGGSLYTLTNMKDNRDLVVVSIAIAVSWFFAKGQIYVLFSGVTLLTSTLSFILSYFTTFMGCVVFVSACMRLKEITVEV